MELIAIEPLLTPGGRRRRRDVVRAVPIGRDVSLVRGMADGDRDALASLYHAHAAPVLAYLVALVADRGLAEDLLQETLLAAWRAAGGFRGDANVRTWLLAIARGKARDAARRRSLPLATDDSSLIEVVDPRDGPDEVVLARAGVKTLAELVAGLRPLLREVVVLALVEELAMADIARVLEVPVGTAKSRLSAARRELARLLTEAGEGEGRV